MMRSVFNAEKVSLREGRDLQETDASARIHQLINDLGAPLVKVVQRDARHCALIVRLEGRHVALCLGTR